jgi:hypothetical protein
VDYRGVDFSRAAVEMAAAATGRPELFTVSDIFAHPVTDATCVVMLETLEHIRRDVELVQRVPAGMRIVLSVPNFMSSGHVRCFSSMDQVIDRYAPMIDVYRFGEIKPAMCDIDHKSSLFLLCGTRSSAK